MKHRNALALCGVAVSAAAILALASSITSFEVTYEPGTYTPPQGREALAITFDANDAEQPGRWGFAEDGWSGAISDQGEYVVTTSSEAVGSRFQTLAYEELFTRYEMRNISAHVAVSANFHEEFASAGLFYSVDDHEDILVAFGLCPEQRFCLFSVEDGEFYPLISEQSNSIQANGRNVLAISPLSDGGLIYINGQRVGRFTYENMNGTRFGMFQAGRGDYVFDDLTVYPEVPGV